MRVGPFVMDRKGIPEHRQAIQNRLPPLIEIGSQPVDMFKLFQKLRNAALAGARALIRKTGRHGPDLARGKACRDQIADASGPAKIGLAIAAIAVFRALGIHKARLLVMAQHALCDPKPSGRFLDLHLDPFPGCPSTLTLVSRSRGISTSRRKLPSRADRRQIA